METSTGRDKQNQQSFLHSPTSHGSGSTPSSNSNCSNTTATNNNNQQPSPPLPSPKPITRSEQANSYPTTFVQADTPSFKQVVQMLTGSPRTTAVAATAQPHQPDPPPKSSHAHNIPPIKTTTKKYQSSGFKLYERRNSLKNFNINPLNPIFAPPSSGFSSRKPEILSPSMLDFPALVLSPVTPLIPDPFDRSGATNYASCHSPRNNHNNNNNNNNTNSSSSSNNRDTDAEDREIKEKGFYLHPSPATTPREAEPRLLSLFPVTSPNGSGSVNP